MTIENKFNQEQVHESAMMCHDMLMCNKYQTIIDAIYDCALRGEFKFELPRSSIDLECIDWLNDKGFYISVDTATLDNWEPYSYDNVFRANKVKVGW